MLRIINKFKHSMDTQMMYKAIRFWDFKHNQQLQIFNEHASSVYGIEFSQFKMVDIYSLNILNGHEDSVCCVDISPLQSNNNDNKSNNIGVISGNDIQFVLDHLIKRFEYGILKQQNDRLYGSNELLNTVLSGSFDKSVRLWDIRSGQQIQVFNGHEYTVYTVEYSPFVIDNKEIGCSSNVICSGSYDNTIRFWDIRSNKNKLYVIKGDKKEDGVMCFKFVLSKRKKITISKNQMIIVMLIYIMV
ncbi:hypothetical protein RFI_03853 [Reticulomyxa filosa]|uniref:Uncharacterized protein n=1 Tax=Reticulomyxa filosa TaxID=46433 RepID=X6P588_RETFI|nr:hypothetical protein RFI_03853 [Reticulomyxa filosa]|eukprot:ETO33254.1 hypothetical protein RFI_03853 [Reticulomyxa filosa]